MRYRGKRGPNPGSDRRSVTVTFGYPEGLRSVVAKTLRDALADAARRWGQWETVESISTPDTIYADLTGRTKANWQPGRNNQGGNQTEADKLERALGRRVRPGEIGTHRREPDELPRVIRLPDPVVAPWSPSQARWKWNRWHRPQR